MTNGYSHQNPPGGRNEVGDLKSVVKEVQTLKTTVDDLAKLWMEDSGIQHAKSAADSAGKQYSELVGLLVEREANASRRWKLLGKILGIASLVFGSLFAGYKFVLAPPPVVEVKPAEVQETVEQTTTKLQQGATERDRKINILSDKTIEQDELIVDSVDRIENLIRAAHPRETKELDQVPVPDSIKEIRDKAEEKERTRAREELWRERGL